jgi:hypothetical protein
VIEFIELSNVVEIRKAHGEREGSQESRRKPGRHGALRDGTRGEARDDRIM